MIARAVLLLASGALLSGCVAAAAIPVAAAGGAVARKATQDRRAQAAQDAPPPASTVALPQGEWKPTGLTELPPPSGTPAVPVRAPSAKVPPEMQFLYGSGEAAALSLQAYQGLWTYLHNEIGYRRDKSAIRSVVLTPDSTLASPKFETCGNRPLAIVLDIDETALLNLGFESDAARRGNAPYDESRWTRWEQTGADKVLAVPGAAETIAAARRDGIRVIFNSNRSAATAAQTIAALDHAGLGPAVPGDTLFLRGAGEPGGKDARRWKIAERNCIVAMVGDQLGDFSDLFNAAAMPVPVRRNLTAETLIAPLWGAGWFMLPNPVYGSALKGGIDEVFPKDKQWADPAEETK